jgi:hypothetical protein
MLVVPPAREWGVFAKPDLLALAFSTAGLLVASVASRRVLWAAPLFALALLTKQTAVAAPLAVGLWLLLTPGRRRQAVLLGGLTAALTLGPLVVLELGPAEVIWHLVVANARGWFWDRFDDIGLAFLEIYRPMLLATLLLPLAWWRRPLTPLAYYLPLAVATMLAAGLPGSSRNYAIEAGLALAIGAGLAVGWLGQSRQRLARGLALGCVALIGWQAVVLWNLPERTYGRRPPTAEATGRMRVMLNFLRNEAAPGPVLSENVGLVVQAGRPVEYNDPSLMYKLAMAGTWDQQPLLDQLTARHFAVIMTEINLETSPERAGRWTPEMIAAIQANYRVLHRDVLIVYTPRE